MLLFFFFFIDFDKWIFVIIIFKGVMKDRWMLIRKEDESVKFFIEKRFGSSFEVMCRKCSGNYR